MNPPEILQQRAPIVLVSVVRDISWILCLYTHNSIVIISSFLSSDISLVVFMMIIVGGRQRLNQMRL